MFPSHKKKCKSITNKYLFVIEIHSDSVRVIFILLNYFSELYSIYIFDVTLVSIKYWYIIKILCLEILQFKN